MNIDLAISRQRASDFVGEETGRATSPSSLRLWGVQFEGLLREATPFSTDPWGADSFTLTAACVISALRAVGLPTSAIRNSLLHSGRGLNRLRARIEQDRSEWNILVTDAGCFPIPEDGLEPETLDELQADGTPRWCHRVTIGKFARAARRLIENS